MAHEVTPSCLFGDDEHTFTPVFVRVIENFLRDDRIT